MFDGFGLFQHAFRGVLDVLEALADALVGQGENRMLGMIQNVLWLISFFEGLGADLAGDLDELTKQKLPANNFGIRKDAC
jgi:hypothetical protein